MDRLSSRSIVHDRTTTRPVGVRQSPQRAGSRRAMVRRRRAMVGLLLLAAMATVVAYGGSPARPTRRRTRRRATSVLATSPAPDATGVAETATLVVETSAPLPTDVPLPTLSPPVPGRWSACGGDDICFQPSAPYPANEPMTVTIPLAVAPRHASSRRSDDHDDPRRVTRAFSLRFTVAPLSVGLAQLLLAQLRYLPLRAENRLTATTTRGPIEPLSTTPGTGSAATTSGSTVDPATRLTWRYPHTPSAVRRQWQPGVDSPMTEGAIVQFERVHDLGSGSYPPYVPTLSPALWRALLQASLEHAVDPDPYSVAEVSETLPEHLTIWSDGADVLRTLVNTGVPGGATPTGAFYVYLRYTSQTMHGTTTTGTPYVYPNVPDVNYFSGNFAIHGFTRSSYGFPQSQGCVEVPLAEAPEVFGDLHYGSLVLVS